jgi:hypothetical protein
MKSRLPPLRCELVLVTDSALLALLVLAKGTIGGLIPRHYSVNHS